MGPGTIDIDIPSNAKVIDILCEVLQITGDKEFHIKALALFENRNIAEYDPKDFFSKAILDRDTYSIGKHSFLKITL